MNLKIDVSGTNIDLKNEQELKAASRKWYEYLNSGKGENTGWVDLPVTFDKNLLDQILAAAAYAVRVAVCTLPEPSLSPMTMKVSTTSAKPRASSWAASMPPQATMESQEMVWLSPFLSV